jgi:hypothetical protein
MEFVEAPPFTRHLADYLNEESYRELQACLAANPEAGDLMPGTGGFRKLRWGMRGAAKDEEVDCELFTTTSSPAIKSG